MKELTTALKMMVSVRFSFTAYLLVAGIVSSADKAVSLKLQHTSLDNVLTVHCCGISDTMPSGPPFLKA